MSKSLNQAFIKAYAKGKRASANEQVGQQVESNGAVDPAESFLVRFDTATVPIPTPHLRTQRPDRSTTAATAPTPTRPSLNSANSTAVDQRVSYEPHRSLRDSFPTAAAENSTRGFSGSHIAPEIQASGGSFPASPPAAQPENEDSLREAIVSQMMQASDWQSTVWEQSSVDANQRAVRDTVSPEGVSRDAAAPDGGVPDRTAAPNRQSPATPAESQLGVGGDDRSSLTMNHDAEELTGDRISHQHQGSPQEREQREQGGSIFRLDRPSYYQARRETQQDEPAKEDYHRSSHQDSLSQQGGSSGEQVENLTEASAKAREPSASAVTASENLPKSSSNPGSPDPSKLNSSNRLSEDDAKYQATRAVEERLRRAKARVFNPVWEVDRLQWPEVCSELMQQKAENMDRVARHLIDACQEGLQVLAVTSPGEGEGRTTVACCLAMLAGIRGLNVAIVDGDMETPSLTYQTNLEVESDWKTALEKQVPLEEVSIHSIDDQVTLVPLLNPISHQEIAADDNRIAFMLQELSNSFDLVILDTGHMNSTRSLVTSMSEQGIISAVVAVVDHRHSDSQRVETCLQRIRKAGVVSIGVVENFAA